MSKEQAEEKRSVTLRPANAEDYSFLRDVYATTRAEEMKIVPWDDAQKSVFIDMQFAAQQQHYSKHYPEAEHQIILLDGLPVGRIYVDRRSDEIRILDVTVLPEYRGVGVGTPLIKQIMREGAETNKPVRIHVDNFTPAIGIFERLGFKSVENNGVSSLMEWKPGT